MKAILEGNGGCWIGRGLFRQYNSHGITQVGPLSAPLGAGLVMCIEISSLVSLAKGAACLQRQILQRWSLQHNVPASSIPAVRMYSTQTAESKEEEPLHTIISNTENVKGGPGTHALWGCSWGTCGSRCAAGEPFSAVLLPLEEVQVLLTTSFPSVLLHYLQKPGCGGQHGLV